MKMKKQTLTGAVCAGIYSLGVIGNADTALYGRLPATPGGTDYLAYYDDGLGITWAADANINGAMNWADANNWAAARAAKWGICSTLRASPLRRLGRLAIFSLFFTGPVRSSCPIQPVRGFLVSAMAARAQAARAIISSPGLFTQAMSVRCPFQQRPGCLAVA